MDTKGSWTVKADYLEVCNNECVMGGGGGGKKKVREKKKIFFNQLLI